MSDLTFEIHTTNGEVSTQTFQKAVNDALYLVGQYDAGVSKTSRGILNWYVSDLHSNGSMAIEFISHLKKTKKKFEVPENIAPRITESLLTGVDDIEIKGITPSYLSETGLERFGEFANLLDKGTATKFSFTTAERTVEITTKTSENIRKILPIKRTAYGSIEGRIEVINVHKRNKALLYHAVTNKIITCYFNDWQLDFIKDALKKRVLVSGELKKNIHGDTMRIENPQIEIIEGKKRFALSDKDAAKKMPSFANASSTAEYLRRVRDG